MPPLEFTSPAVVINISFFREQVSYLPEELEHRNKLISFMGTTATSCNEKFQTYQNDDCQLRIELHHEYINYIWYIDESPENMSVEKFYQSLPESWLEQAPTEVFSKNWLNFEKGKLHFTPSTALSVLFGDNQILASFTERGSARVWTDFKAHMHDGFTCFYVEDLELGPKRSGRIAHRLIDMQNYRKLAEISWPVAEEIIFKLERYEKDLSNLIDNISQFQVHQTEQDLLTELFDISIVSENWRNTSAHRFSATQAYQRILMDRIDEFQESKVLGYQSVASFLKRTSLPVFRTCNSANDRLNTFISRIDRATSLLSTKIRSRTEQQNIELLHRVENQNAQQIILQETIEAFAIVAISYNFVALLQLLVESLIKRGVNIDSSLVLIISVPASLILSYGLIKFLKYKKNYKATKINKP